MQSAAKFLRVATSAPLSCNCVTSEEMKESNVADSYRSTHFLRPIPVKVKLGKDGQCRSALRYPPPMTQSTKREYACDFQSQRSIQFEIIRVATFLGLRTKGRATSCLAEVGTVHDSQGRPFLILYLSFAVGITPASRPSIGAPTRSETHRWYSVDTEYGFPRTHFHS